MKKIILGSALIFVFGVSQATSINYLDPKTAFCYSNASLGKYLKFAQARDIDGLNKLVLAGECDFVADDSYLSIENYQDGKIAGTSVVSFKSDEKLLWTFKQFVQNAELN